MIALLCIAVVWEVVGIVALIYFWDKTYEEFGFWDLCLVPVYAAAMTFAVLFCLADHLLNRTRKRFQK